MKGLRFERARTRLAWTGALLAAVFLSLLAWTTRSIVRSTTFADIDEELYTLSVALGSSFELDWGIGTAAPHGLAPDALSHAQPAPPFSLA